MDAKIQHLLMIQGVVSRMAQCSFFLKGWTVLLVSALLALPQVHYIFWLPALAVTVLWGLDGYFLWQERLFRDLYNDVRELPEDRIDFSMRTPQRQKWIRALFSRTLIPFYGLLLVAGIVSGIARMD